MKAKDYAAQFNAKPDVDTVCEIGAAFISEVAQLAKTRHVETMPGLVAILAEQQRKWAAFCRLTGGRVKEEALGMMLKEIEPALYWYYTRATKGKG